MSLSDILSTILDFFQVIGNYLNMFLDFILSFFFVFPIKLIGLFKDLPSFVSIGFSCLISVIVVISILKLISYIKGNG